MHNYNTRNKDKLRPAIAKLAYRDIDVRLVGVHVWNYICDNINIATSFVSFKRILPWRTLMPLRASMCGCQTIELPSTIVTFTLLFERLTFLFDWEKKLIPSTNKCVFCFYNLLCKCHNFAPFNPGLLSVIVGQPGCYPW